MIITTIVRKPLTVNDVTYMIYPKFERKSDKAWTHVELGFPQFMLVNKK